MTLATCAKDVTFYTWPNISFIGVYESPIECMNIKTISWCCDKKQVLVVKSIGNPITINVPSKPEQSVDPLECLHANYTNVGTYSNTNPYMAAFGFEDGEIHLYSIEKKKKFLADYRRLPSAIQNLEFSADDHNIAVGCSNGQIFLLDAKLKPCASFMLPNVPTLSTIAFCPRNYNLLAGASREGILALWETETCDNLFYNKCHSGRIPDIAFSQNTISSIGIDGKFVSCDLRSYKVACCFELDCPLTSLAYVPYTYEVAISTSTSQLRSYDVRNMLSPVRTFVANNINGGFKKISFAKILNGSSASTLYGSKNIPEACKYDLSASGDFSISTDSSGKPFRYYDQKPCDCPLTENTEVVPPVEEAIRTTKDPKFLELQEFGKVLEEKLRVTSQDFEDQIQGHFYELRIDASKQFIGIEEKINKSWDSFVSYLKLSGGQSMSQKPTDEESQEEEEEN